MGSSQFGVVLIASILIIMPSLCVTTSDPRASLCDPVCWGEEALSDQCVQDRCTAHKEWSRAYRRCLNRCWDIVAPCRRMCNREFIRVLETCERTCAPDPNTVTTTVQPGCEEYCFTHNMMLIKARLQAAGNLPTRLR